jgi:hypothetical protein
VNEPDHGEDLTHLKLSFTIDPETGFTLVISTAGETEDTSGDEEEAEEAEDDSGGGS